jgi:hypothetical protein
VAFLAEVFILPPIIKLLPRIFDARALRRQAAVAAGVAVLLVFGSAPAAAQAIERPTGNASLFTAWFPGRDTTDLRARLFVEQTADVSDRLTLTASGFVEGLAGRRPEAPYGTPQPGSPAWLNAGIARLHEATAELRLGQVDLYAGYGRVVWGRLDELQPTDVINPLEISRFFFEGRNEARLPVAVVRARVYLTDDASIEGVYVPVFRRGRFDLLGEPTSPFNITPAPEVAVCLAVGCPPLPVAIDERTPSTRWRNGQGGARLSATAGRVDWSVSAYRGFEAFPLVALQPAAMPPAVTLVSTHPRFTMIGGDFETVAGQWGMRGEVAAFVRDSFQGGNLAIVPGTSFDAGLGVDRRAGSYQFSGTVLVHRERPDAVPASGLEARTDVSVIVSADRTFARERYRLRAFSVYNTSESSAFLRGIGVAKLHDDVALEGSAGWFAGDGRDTIGRFSDSDFAYVRLKYYF